MTTPARVPYSRLSPGSFGEVDRELQKLERFGMGLFQPRVITFALSPYAVQSTDTHLLCDATAGAITLTFPAAARVNGLTVVVTKTDASANAVTLSGTFSGLTNPTLATQYAAKMIQSANGVYYFTPELSAADIAAGTFPGTAYTFSSVNGSVTVRPGFNYNGCAFDVSQVNVANNGTLSFAPNSDYGLVMITANADATSALVGIRGAANTLDLFVSSGSWGTTFGGAHVYNVYYDAGSTSYKIQNLSGFMCAFTFARFGVMPNV